MQIIRGKIPSAQKVVCYGPEGIGKSTFASKFPDPLFIDTEGSTTHMDVMRTQRPSSWTMLMEQVTFIKNNPGMCKTLIIDTCDWAEMLCAKHICDKANVKGIEDFGYGKGYTWLEEEFGRFLNLLSEVITQGINVVITAHAQMRKFEQPDEMGAYDRWELKLEKKTSALLKEWADMVLFANYKTLVVNVDNQGTAKGKNKPQGGSRVMYTTHHPCWDAKNRHDLAPELPFEFSAISGLLIDTPAGKAAPVAPVAPMAPPVVPVAVAAPSPVAEPIQTAPVAPPPVPAAAPVLDASIPKALRDLMQSNNVKPEDIQQVVAQKGYYPIDTPIKNYDAGFVSGVLVGAWPQVYEAICANALPFST